MIRCLAFIDEARLAVEGEVEAIVVQHVVGSEGFTGEEVESTGPNQARLVCRCHGATAGTHRSHTLREADSIAEPAELPAFQEALQA